MTQGVFPFPRNDLSFAPTPDILPPENIDAEETVLGGLLLDQEAIYQVKDRLSPEHFYIDAHREIYRACLHLHKKRQPITLLTVTTWLSDHKRLNKIGGRNKLATLVDRTVGSTNIDALAGLVIEKSIRRDLLRLGNDFIHLGYNTELDLVDILDVVSKKTRSIVATPSVQSKEENERWVYNKLLEDLKVIFTTIPDPGFRQWKLQLLAEEYLKSVKFLDNLYAKSLATQCSKLMDYDDLKAAAGASVREWLINGLVPKKTTIVLYADGGLGKTKFVYGLGKHLIQGAAWGQFLPTGEKRKVLYYQGDETEADMLQALEALGYDQDDINKYVRCRFGWSFENMPLLIQDLNEFKPDFVVIDSLTHANRLSTYRESDMEYCRPLLEITGLANQHNCTFLVIHHSNKEGGIRGTTAIRNSVSEVWRITKDNSADALPDDRFLEIDKSRSRSSGKKYRMIFNSSDDLSFTFLGEETQQGADAAEQSAKKQILKFFDTNRNIKFTAEELAKHTGYSNGHLRNCLAGLTSDGLISVDRRPGKAHLYYLVMENDPTDDQRRSPHDHPDDHLKKTPVSIAGTSVEGNLLQCIPGYPISDDQRDDHLYNLDIVSDTAEADRPKYKKNLEKSTFSKKDDQLSRSADQLCPNALSDKDSGGDRNADREVIGGDRDADRDQQPTTTLKPNTLSDKDSGGDRDADREVIGGDRDADRDQQPTITPKIEEGRIYWSRSLNKQVKVVKVYPSVKKADCFIAGDAIAKPRLAFSDLLLSPPALTPGDKVTVLEGEHRGQDLLVSSVDGDNIWLKKHSQKFAPPLSNKGQPYKANQLRR